jgi:hypothetical protein
MCLLEKRSWIVRINIKDNFNALNLQMVSGHSLPYETGI